MWRKIMFNAKSPQLKATILQNFKITQLCNLAQVIDNGDESFITRLRLLHEKGEMESNDKFNKLEFDCINFLISKPVLQVEVSMPNIIDIEFDVDDEDVTTKEE